MKTQQNNYKIDPVTRRLISEMALELPRIPFLIEINGEVIAQRMSHSELIMGDDLKKQAPTIKVHGEDVKSDKKYVSRSFYHRERNHKVELTQMYLKYGEKGLQAYKQYVLEIAEQISTSDVNQKLEETSGTNAANDPQND